MGGMPLDQRVPGGTRPAADPSRRPARAQRGATLSSEIQRVWDGNHRVCGVRMVWRQLHPEGIAVARCTVGRLMRDLGLRGAVRGRAAKTTQPSSATACPEDRVQRDFRPRGPNAL